MITGNPVHTAIKIEEASESIKATLSDNESNDFSAFINNLLKYVSPEDIEAYQTEDLKGMMATLFRHLQSKPSNEAIIFNPNVEEHGWQSPHSIVLIHHTDVRYLIDSVRNILNRQQIKMHTIFHGYYSISRDASGKLISLEEQDKNNQKTNSGADELLLYIEIDRNSRTDEIKELKKLLNQTINDVEIVAEDYPGMSTLIDKAMASLDSSGIDADIIKESKIFLQWIKEGHFTFLAYDEYDLNEKGVTPVKNSGVGLFRKYNQPKTQLFDEMTQLQIDTAIGSNPIIFSKSGYLSSVHRAAYSDYIIVKRFDKQGNVNGGYRFMGLYKHKVYLNNANTIPLIRKKIQRILDKSGITADTYNYAELTHILETFPRDELFQSSIDHLLTVGLNVLYLQERRKSKLFIREDIDKKFISAIFYAPRDLLNSKLRQQAHDLIASHLNVESSTTSTWFSESALARCRFVYKLKEPLKNSLEVEKLEHKIIALSTDWNEELQSALNESLGEEKGLALYRQYRNAFPASYTEENRPRVAVTDINRIQQLIKDDSSLSLSFYRTVTIDENELKIKIYHRGNQLSLSDMIPVLENFGLKVIEEFPYYIEQPKENFWIYNFTVDFPSDSDIDPDHYRQLLADAFSAVWSLQAEDDVFNQLVLKAGLTWRQVTMLRTYSRYMKQINIGFSQKFIALSLINHTDIAKKLVAFFDCRFNPEKKRSEKTAERLIEQLNSLYEKVASLSEDRILRQFLELLQATLRTNFFQNGDNGLPYKAYLSVKLNPYAIKEIPLPRPKYEIFVYSPRVEGVHLRGGKVARGGLRWSDRTEDFRTEILGLVKAQQVKNAVIVPVGAKGGFIAKQLPPPSDRDAFWQEGIACYKTFIRGLLDLTDNLKEDDVIPPQNIVRYDEDDPYLVVAADKGTATFSDIANEISMEYGHWLGDAFASGGSNGYDHKKMGITARGAWVSVQRHFREMGINIQKQPFTVVGIGDMSGDVFGNGMLLSEQIKLVGAFNHLHIFIDPTPDTASSYAERKRLFALPRSSWLDYDQSLISKGGGIFDRSSKSIILSPEIQALVNTDKKTVTPNELISLLLKSHVDMLWNGGIGTYVKASSEAHSDVGDKTNDAVRINAKELQCKVVGEGGNLGLTQRARIEYALLGGAIFTDFIDNAGGVDCSDHEVNIKILLDKIIAVGELTDKQRNRHLEKMTESVSQLVLSNNYRQTLAIALANLESTRRVEEYRRVITYLESTGKLNRALEFLPDDDALNERRSQQQGLTTPELSILISYVKSDMKEALASMDWGDDLYTLAYIKSAFPDTLVKQFNAEVNDHPLKKEIIATQIANDMFNHMGITFFERLQKSTGATHGDVAKAYVAAKEIFGLSSIWKTIEALDYKIDSDLQYHMMMRVSRLVRRASRWLIKNHRNQLNASALVELYQSSIQGLLKKLPSLLPDPLREQWQSAYDELIDMGAPENLASILASCDYLYDFLGIIAVSNLLNKKITIVASGYFTLSEKLELDDFSAQMESKMPATTHWQAMAREALRDDLEWQQRQLTQNILSNEDCNEKNIEQLIDTWLQEQELLTARWKHIVSEIGNHTEADIAIFSIAIRELSDLNQATTQTI